MTLITGTKLERNQVYERETSLIYRDRCNSVVSVDSWVRHHNDQYVKLLVTIIGLILIFPCHPFASDRTGLARITVYWPGEGSGKSAAWNSARLREDHCAVDPKKIPYGSKVVFDGGECKAIDTGPDVGKRKAARSAGRTAAERNAVVIDRFFDTKERALTWANAHPDFMLVRVQTAETEESAK